MLIDLIKKPFEFILGGIFLLSKNLVVSILILAVIFGIIYFLFNLWRERVTVRVQLAGIYARKFKESFISSPKVFDEYLTRIYKQCKVNQLSTVIFGIVNFFLLVIVINLIYEPLSSAYGFSEAQRTDLAGFLSQNYGVDKNAGDFTLINSVFANSSAILATSSFPECINSILNSSVSLFGVSFIEGAKFNSISIVIPIVFLALYITNVIKGVKKAIKEKTMKSVLFASIGIFFLVSIASSAFFMPLLYFVFILGYRLTTLCFSLIEKKHMSGYIETLGRELKPKCDDIFNEAQIAFDNENNKDSAHNNELIETETLNESELKEGENKDVSANVVSRNNWE